MDLLNPLEIVKAAKETVPSAVRHTLSDTWNLVLGNRVAQWQLQNIANTQAKAKKYFDELGLKPNIDKIPPRYGYAWFEEAAKHDEPEIQDLFATLLAKAASGDDNALDTRLLNMVTKFTPAEAELLEFLEEILLLNRVSTVDESGMLVCAVETGSEFLRTAVTERFDAGYIIALDHLMSVGALQIEYSVYNFTYAVDNPETLRPNSDTTSVPYIDKNEAALENKVSFTELGLALVRALSVK